MTVTVRPMTAADVLDAQQSSFHAFRAASRAFGGSFPEENTPASVEWGARRIRHFLQHDPGSAFVAEDADGAIAGVALASVRDDLWFLSLLTVRTDLQGHGIGRELLRAVLVSAAGCGRGTILASQDPKALASYRRAGFRLLPAFRAAGRLRRERVPRAGLVSEGDYARHAEFVQDVARQVRGAALGPDLCVHGDAGAALHVVDAPAGRGYAVGSASGVQCLAATSDEVAAELLWCSLAEASAPELSVQWLTADQHWAVDVVAEAGLELGPGPSWCVRGMTRPPTPYLPAGAYG